MLQGWQKKTSILKNSWYSQISLAYIHFSKLFIWKAFQTYRCKNKNSTQTTHTPSPQICLLLNICPVYHLLSFTCTFPYIHTHIHALLQSHPAPTCSHLKQTCACAHTHTLTSSYTTHTVLCWVLCGSLSKQPGVGEFCDKEKAKWGMLFGDGSTAPLPTPHLQSKSKHSSILA